MRKLFSWLLSLAIIVSICPVKASATGKISLSTSKDGENITVTYGVEKYDSVGSMESIIMFPKEVVELVSVTGNEFSPLDFESPDISNANTNGIVKLGYSSETLNTVTVSGTIATLKFKIIAGATPGDYAFTLTKVSMLSGDLTTDYAAADASLLPITAAFSIPKAPITSVTIAGLDAPAKGGTPDTDVTVTPAGLTADVKWFNGETEVSGPFAASTKYTVKIKLTASSGDNFAETVDAGDYTATRNSETELLLTKTFNPTPDKVLTKLAITGNTIGTKHHGDTIDQSELTVTATYDDTSIEADFKDYTIVYNGGDTALKKGDNSITVEVGSVKSAALPVNGVLGQVLTAADFDFTTPNEVTYSGISQLVALTSGAVSRKGDDPTTPAFFHNMKFKVTNEAGSPVTAPTNVGTYTIKFWWTADPTDTHEARTEAEALTFTGKIKPAPLTVTANAHTITYGDAPANSGVTISGFVNSETATVLTGTLGYTYDYTQYGDVGEYTITPTGYTSTNYDITYKPGKLTVGQKEVGLTWSNITGRVWGDEKAVTATATGTVNGDVVDVTVSGGGETAVGNHTATATDLTGTKAGNYKLPTTKTQTYSIGKATAPTGIKADFEVLFSDTAAKTVEVNDFTGLPTDIANAKFKGAAGTKTDPGIIETYSNTSFTLKSGLTAGDKDKQASWTVNIESDNYDVITATVNVKVIDKTIDTDTLKVSQGGIIYGGSVSPTVANQPAGTGTVTYTYEGRAGTIYSSSATAPTNVGKYKVKAKCESSTTIYTAEANFEIQPKSISSMTVTLSDTSLEYNGSARTVNVTVKDGTTTLIKDTHYTVTGVTSSTNVGSYTVTVTGKGNYTDSVGRTWKITQGTPTYTVPTGLTAKYGQTLADVNIAATTGWSWMNTGTAVGTPATKNFPAKFTPTDAINYKTVENIDVSVDVGKADGRNIENVELTQKYTDTSEHTYAPDWSGLPSGQTWNYASSYALSAGSTAGVTHSIDNATGKLTYAVSGAGVGDVVTITLKAQCNNYKDYTITLKINLTAKDNQAALTLTGATTVVYGQTLQLGTSGGSGTGAVTYTVADVDGQATVDASGKLTPAKVGTVKVKATKAADTSFNEATSAEVEITITKATPAGTPTYTAITTSGKTLANANLTVGTITPAGGSIAWDMAADTVVAANTAYGWTYTPADSANYNPLKGSITPYVVTYSGGGGGSSTPSYSITVDKTENGTITVSPKSASKGDAVTITVKPDKGYELDTLKVLDKDGDALKLTEKNGKYTFKMPSGKVTVKGSFVEEAPVQIFKDVPVDAYYYEAVKWAAEKGITGGVGNGLFAPNQPCTRAQIVTFLWRAAGSPAPKHMSSFTDVSADAFYAKAVAWAVENGITGGTGDGKFSPDATCTRAQSVTFLYRAAGSPKVSGSAEFGDVATNAYYADAVAWAAKNGITGGIGGGLFGSGNDCTRAQIVTFLYRSVK